MVLHLTGGLWSNVIVFWRKFILHKLEVVWLRKSGPRGLVQGEKLVFDLSCFPYL